MKQKKEILSLILNEKYEVLDHAELMIGEKDSAILERDNIIAWQHAEIAYMKNSKFWKIRNLYVGLQLNKLHPKHIVGKLNIKKNVSFEDKRKKEEAGGEKPIVRSVEYKPKISVIVPNYNHEKYLKQRLNSIYSQTYKNFEVILLDDNSSDGSRKILRAYEKKHKANTRCIFNEKNSGNVFLQWKRGIKEAKGELVWIAESDDYCDENFLEELVPYLFDESVMLAYAYPKFVNQSGEASDFTFETYTSEISNTKWANTYVETAHNEVNAALGIKNTIPNVSGVIFRNISIDQFDYDSLRQFRVCGDWYYYLSIIRGGKLAFVKETNNYYRFHPSNTSSNYHKNIEFVKEHEQVANHVARSYKITPEILRRNREAVRHVWESQNPGRENEFDRAYKPSELKAELKNRKPNILMSIYGFTTGGGEVVPIQLANKLKEYGYPVTVFEYHPIEHDTRTTRKMLDQSIPVLRRTAETIDDFLNDFGIDLIHSHHAEVDVYFARRKNLNIPQIVTTHGMYEALSKHVVEGISQEIKNVAFWVYVANKNLIPLEKYGWFAGKPKKKIMNGFPRPNTVSKLSRTGLKLNNDDFVVCLASRAIKEKGWREAADAVRIANMLSKRRITLLLIGDGPVYEELKDVKSDDLIRPLGFRRNVFDYFMLADLGILPTFFLGESAPLTLIECVSAQRPFISTDIGEIKSMLTIDDGSVAGEVLSLKNGRVDVYELAESIAKMANNKSFYEQCCRIAVECSKKFLMDVVIREYEKTYEEVLKK